MARIRSIHPDICIDKGLAEMDDARAERTFMRLWTYCDDDGRAMDDSRLIKAAIYPRLDSMTPDEVEIDIAKLASLGFIVRYEADGDEYLHVPSFAKWQRPNRKVDSKHPAPPSGAPHVQSSEQDRAPHEHAPPVVVGGDVVVVEVVEGADASVEPPRDKRGTKLPRDFTLTHPMRLWAKTNDIKSSVERETPKFVDHFRAKGEIKQDWLAAWRNWMRKADEYAAERSGGKKDGEGFLLNKVASRGGNQSAIG